MLRPALTSPFALVLLAGLQVLLACGRSDNTVELSVIPRDIVVISIDTLRPDRLVAYGASESAMPFLDAQLEQACVFTQAHSSSSWTAPSVASIFSGLDPMRHGLTEGLFVQQRELAEARKTGATQVSLRPLAPELPRLATLLRDQGYRTLGLVSNPNLGAELGLSLGFTRMFKKSNALAARLVDELAEWESGAREPGNTLYFLHFNDPHFPYLRHAPWYRRGATAMESRINAYTSELHYLDAQLGRLFDDPPWRRDALIVWLSDHGEEFGEHGGVAHAGGLYAELGRVLMAYGGPGLRCEQQASELTVGLVDVMPTVLDLVGVTPPPGLDGVSLAPLVLGAASDAFVSRLRVRTLFAHRIETTHVPETFAALRGRWKRIEQGDVSFLFDLQADRFDTDDRAASAPKEATELATALRDFRKRGLAAPSPARTIELDTDAADMLEELGYLE